MDTSLRYPRVLISFELESGTSDPDHFYVSAANGNTLRAWRANTFQLLSLNMKNQMIKMHEEDSISANSVCTNRSLSIDDE